VHFIIQKWESIHLLYQSPIANRSGYSIW
jgi:hypothetical protein